MACERVQRHAEYKLGSGSERLDVVRRGGNRSRQAVRAIVQKGTRMPIHAIADNDDAGLTAAEVTETFDIPLASVKGILAYRYR